MHGVSRSRGGSAFNPVIALGFTTNYRLKSNLESFAGSPSREQVHSHCHRIRFDLPLETYCTVQIRVLPRTALPTLMAWPRLPLPRKIKTPRYKVEFFYPFENRRIANS
jgi:hypothetical protein